VKSSVRSFRALLGGTTAVSLALAPVASRANPLGGQVTAGTATIQGQGTSAVTVDQSTSRAIIDWRSFDIAPGETTQFVQPGPNAVTLNRVTGGLGVSQINGMIKANGDVYVVNPDGILFGPSANVNVGGFLATTRDIADSDFMAGKNHFAISGDRSASIVNQGTITAANGGFAALVAPGVRNDGIITANLGTVGLSAAKGFTLDLYGDNLIKLRPSDAIAAKVVDVATGLTLKSLVENTGKLQANGGKVALTAAATRRALDSVINSSGVVEANTVGAKNGLVVFGAATAGMKPARAPSQTVKVSGKIRAAGRQPGTVGGKIEIAGEKVVLAKAMLDASGEAGGGEILVGGGFKRGAPAALAVTQNGQSFQSSQRPNATTITVDAATALNASAVASGDGGDVAIWSKANMAFSGTILATGGSGGIAETSGGALSIGGATVHAGEWLLDPYSLTVDAAAASSINSSLNSGASVTLQTTAFGATGPGTAHPSGKGDIFVNSPIRWDSAATLTLSAFRNIDVNADITASGGGSLSLTTGTGGAGDYAIATGKSVSFTGGASSGSVLSIGGHSYTLLYDMTGVQNVNASGAALGGYYALATSLDATGVSSWTPIGTDGAGNIRNSGEGFAGVFAGLGNSISNLTVDLPSANYIGLFGYSSGTIRDVGDVGGTVTGSSKVGGLVGDNAATLSDVYTTGVVDGVDRVGGLAGESFGTISDSHAAGNVAGVSNRPDVGGLAGYNKGTINQSYATGAVADGSLTRLGGKNVGGLVGFNAGPIKNSYATGATTAAGGFDASGVAVGGLDIGGLIGFNSGRLGQVNATGMVGAVNGANVAGLVGINQGAIVNGYWDIDTSGQHAGVGPESSADGAVGLSASGASPFLAASYAGFDFGSTQIWNIVSGLSFPYLQYQFPTGAPQVISGTGLRAPLLNSGANNGTPQIFGFTVGGVVDGARVGLTTLGRNGFYDLLIPPGTISPKGSGVIVYLVGNPTGDSFYDNATGSVTGLDIYGHYLTLNSGESTVTRIAKDMSKTLWSLTGDEFIFSIGPAPEYKLHLVPDPLGLPSGSDLVINSSAAKLNLDQVPALGSRLDYFLLMMDQNGALLTQSAPIKLGKLSLVGKGANFRLDNANNGISQFAADAASVVLTNNGKLTIGSVNTIAGVTATSFTLDDPLSVRQAQPIIANRVLLQGAAGNYSLTDPANQIDFLAAETGILKVADDQSLTIGDVGGTRGVTTSDHLIVTTVGSGDNLLIADPVSAGTLAKLVSAGAISEIGPGRIEAAALTGQSTGGASLTSNNHINALDSFTNSGSGDLAITDSKTLNVTGSVMEMQPNGALILTTTAGNISIQADGVLSAYTVTLNVEGMITEFATGRIDTALLNVTAKTGIDLVGDNSIFSIGTNQSTSGPDIILGCSGISCGNALPALGALASVSERGSCSLDDSMPWRGYVVSSLIRALGDFNIRAGLELLQSAPELHKRELTMAGCG
jgi:filamentous hemagglutinin family protein